MLDIYPIYTFMPTNLSDGGTRSYVGMAGRGLVANDINAPDEPIKQKGHGPGIVLLATASGSTETGRVRHSGCNDDSMSYATEPVLNLWRALAKRDWEAVKAVVSDDCIFIDMSLGPTVAARGPDNIVKRLKSWSGSTRTSPTTRTTTCLC